MLFEQIQSNKYKTIWIVVLFLLLIELLGVALSYYLFEDFVSGPILVSFFMLFYVPITVFNSQKIVMKMNHAKKISHSSEYPHLWHAVEGLAMVARIPVPTLYIISEESPNAFATGFSPNNASIAVTTSLLEKLNKEELEAVIAHEIAHIKNYDVRLSTISLALVSALAVISDFAIRIIWSKGEKNIFVIIAATIGALLAPIVGLSLHYSLSRNREFLADAVGAELCRNPVALASALIKISEDPDPVDNIPSSAAALYFSEPLKSEHNKDKKKGLGNLFDTHPPVNERINRLMSM